MRQDHEQAALEAGLFQPPFEIGEIAPHDRFDIGVHDRGRDALIFLDLRQHVAGTRHADVRQFFCQPFDRGKFMDGIEIGMQEADRDRGRAGFPDAGDGLVKRALIQRSQNLAIRLEPLANAETQFARHQGLRRRRAQIVAIGLEAFAHFDDVAMALGGQAARPWHPCVPATRWSQPSSRAPAGRWPRAFPHASCSAAAPVLRGRS